MSQLSRYLLETATATFNNRGRDFYEVRDNPSLGRRLTPTGGRDHANLSYVHLLRDIKLLKVDLTQVLTHGNPAAVEAVMESLVRAGEKLGQHSLYANKDIRSVNNDPIFGAVFSDPKLNQLIGRCSAGLSPGLLNRLDAFLQNERIAISLTPQTRPSADPAR